MAEAVYVLCGVTALLCAVLLVRGWLRSRTRLLLSAALCFVALAANNVLLYVDLVMVPGLDLAVLRSAIAVAGLAILLHGLVWEGSSR